MVSIHETTSSLALDHRTYRGRSAAPMPSMLEETTWVEEIGAPTTVDMVKAAPDTIWESREWMGAMEYILLAKVLRIRLPPMIVPRPMANAMDNLAQRGITSVLVNPVDISNMMIRPRNFCESLAPLLNANTLVANHCAWLMRPVD